MKSKTYYKVDQEKMDECVDSINNLEIGNKYQVTISNADTKSTRQHKYQWRLYGDINKSGVGGRHEETIEGAHIVCKYRFALPIILAKDVNFAWLYEMVKKVVGNDTDKLMWFVDKQVSTMDFTVSEAAEYITNMINFYVPLGAVLTDPKEYRL